MIKMMLCCDICGKELKPSYSLIMDSQTKEWSMKQFVFCNECALTIDNAILKFRNKVLNGDHVTEAEGKDDEDCPLVDVPDDECDSDSCPIHFPDEPKYDPDEFFSAERGDGK